MDRRRALLLLLPAGVATVRLARDEAAARRAR
jgi:hypothetical protein